MGGSKERVSVGLQIERLVDVPEKAYKASMREAYKNIGSGMRNVIKVYQRNIIDSRSLFNDKYLTALGYNPRETITYKVVDPALVLAWCKNNIAQSVSSVKQYRWGIPTIEEICSEYLQDTYSNFDFVNKSFSIGGVEWFLTGTTVTGSNSSDATVLKNKETTVGDYATAKGLTVISITEGLVTVSGNNYWSAALSDGTHLVPAIYMTIACPGVNSDVVTSIVSLYTDKEYNMFSLVEDDSLRWSNTIIISAYINDKGGISLSGRYKKPVIATDSWTSRIFIESTQSAMRDKLDEVQKEIDLLLVDSLDRLVVSYTIGNETKLKLAEIDKNIISSEANAEAYPVIPLKENYAMVNESRQLKAMLNKLGMATSDFENSLADSRLKNGAIMFIVDINDASPIGTKVVYETIVNMVETVVPGSNKIPTTENYQLNLGFSDIDMKTTLNFNISNHSGVVADVGSYVRYAYSVIEQVMDSETNRLVPITYTYSGIRKQVTAEYYEQIEFTDVSTKWHVGGYELNDRVWIPITNIALDMLTYEESSYAISLSLNIVLTSVVVTKTKWYQSGFFKFIMLIILIVITYLSFGTASGYTVPAMAALLGTTVATATTIFTVIVVITTTIAALGILGVDTGVWGTAATILGMGTAAIGAYGNMASMTMQQTVLTSAKTLVSLTSMAVDINTKGTIRSIEDKMEMLSKEMEDSEAKLKEITDNLQEGLWMGVADREPDLLYVMSSTQMMCNYDILYDYDGMYNSKINSVGI